MKKIILFSSLFNIFCYSVLNAKSTSSTSTNAKSISSTSTQYDSDRDSIPDLEMKLMEKEEKIAKQKRQIILLQDAIFQLEMIDNLYNELHKVKEKIKEEKKYAEEKFTYVAKFKTLKEGDKSIDIPKKQSVIDQSQIIADYNKIITKIEKEIHEKNISWEQLREVLKKQKLCKDADKLKDLNNNLEELKEKNKKYIKKEKKLASKLEKAIKAFLDSNLQNPENRAKEVEVRLPEFS